jgi:signal transduction histidine kinase
MNVFATIPPEQLQRELNYYRRECNDLGARLLRLQEEQSQAFREARRSRTTAKLVREAYRLADGAASAEEIGGALLDVILDNAMCDRAAFLAETEPGSGRFHVTHAVGMAGEAPPWPVAIGNSPAFFFTTSQTRIEPPAYELTGILKLPYILWAYDRASGHALILGNRSESNVSRPFEPGDQELVEGALSVYLDVLTRKQAELHLRRARKIAEETVQATSEFLTSVSDALRSPLNSIIGCSEKMSSGSRYPLSIERCAEFADHIHESGNRVVALINGILQYSSFAKVTLSLAPDWRPLSEIVSAAVSAGAALGERRRVQVRSEIAPAPLELHVDPAGFGQVLTTLVGAAVRASPVAGRVAVSALLCQDGSLEIGVQGASIADGAAAWDEETQDGPAGVEDLSLPIVRALVEGHDGQMTLHAAAAQETMATIALPAHRVRMAPATGPALAGPVLSPA